MFRVAFFVDDKHLAHVLHAVTGVALNLETHPVANAKVEKGAPPFKKVVAKSHGTPTDRIAAAVAKLDAATVDSKKLKELVAAEGCSPDSYSHFASTLVKRGILERRSQGVFMIKKEAKVHG